MTRRGLLLKLPVRALTYSSALQHRALRRLDAVPNLVQRLPQPPLLLGLLWMKHLTRFLADYVELLLSTGVPRVSTPSNAERDRGHA